MAQSSSVAGAPMSLGEQYDMENNCPIPFDMAVRIVSIMSFNKLTAPDWIDRPPRELKPRDLPLLTAEDT
eukprot:6649665-Karenia_brevis.AAC.1